MATATLGLLKTIPTGLTRDRWHRYVWDNGPAMPSVTTILRLQDALQGSDGLVKWAAAIAVDHVIQHASELEVSTVQRIREEAIAATDGPANIGTDVHETVRRILVGEPLGQFANPYHVAQLAGFLGAERPDVLYAEELVANLTLGYGGQFDFIARIRDRVALVDVKTGKVKPTHRLQIAAYEEAEFIGRPGTDDQLVIPDIEVGYVLVLHADTYELVEQTPSDEDRAHWRRLAQMHAELKRWSKGEAA